MKRLASVNQTPGVDWACLETPRWNFIASSESAWVGSCHFLRFSTWRDSLSSFADTGAKERGPDLGASLINLPHSHSLSLSHSHSHSHSLSHSHSHTLTLTKTHSHSHTHTPTHTHTHTLTLTLTLTLTHSLTCPTAARTTSMSSP